MTERSSLLQQTIDPFFPTAVSGEGIHLTDGNGKRYIDGCSGALVANIGHGVAEIGQAMASQAQKLTYVYRYHFSNPLGEELAGRYIDLTGYPMAQAYFVNSGSEASETAVKLARLRHLAVGESSRFKIVARWQSYHGATMGALTWSGFPARRAAFDPYLQGGIHIPPAYCYRCWFGRTPAHCSLECAQALDDAVRTALPETVSAFIAEPVSGSSLGAAFPPSGYFQAIRDICDRHGILYIAEEVMTGAGRTGTHFFASDHFSARPDLIAFGKGVGGGYYPLAGVLIDQDVKEAIATYGGFAAGQSHSGSPVGMAAGLAVLDFIEQEDLLTKAAENGDYFGQRLAQLASRPSVGDIRGMGMMRGVEFVADKENKTLFDPKAGYATRVYEAARKRGLIFLPSTGCDRGTAGDMALLGPPLIIGRNDIDRICAIMNDAIDEAEKTMGL